MNASEHNHCPPDDPAEYRDNFARHILAVTLYLQSEIMNALTLKHGHSQLRINYEPYIAAAAKRGARLSDIAEILGISRQAANQTANQIEASGYIQRTADPSDGRAKLVVTTPKAKAMIRQGAAEALKIQERLAAIVGKNELWAVNTSIIELNRSLGLLFPFEVDNMLVLPGIMPRLSDYISNRLQTKTMAKGHSQLKRSFGAVLIAIGPHGGRIQQIANTQDVSKQAIGATVSELEVLGYIRRDADPEDARQTILQLTDSGKKLIDDSVASVDELAAEFSGIIGDSAFAQVKEAMARIYRALHLEEGIFGYADNNDIHMMARQLNRQLGKEGAMALARLLLRDEPEHQKGE